jgi:hypothetical protein
VSPNVRCATHSSFTWAGTNAGNAIKFTRHDGSGHVIVRLLLLRREAIPVCAKALGLPQVSPLTTMTGDGTPQDDAAAAAATSAVAAGSSATLKSIAGAFTGLGSRWWRRLMTAAQLPPWASRGYARVHPSPSPSLPLPSGAAADRSSDDSEVLTVRSVHSGGSSGSLLKGQSASPSSRLMARVKRWVLRGAYSSSNGQAVQCMQRPQPQPRPSDRLPLPDAGTDVIPVPSGTSARAGTSDGGTALSLVRIQTRTLSVNDNGGGRTFAGAPTLAVPPTASTPGSSGGGSHNVSLPQTVAASSPPSAATAAAAAA